MSENMFLTEGLVPDGFLPPQPSPLEEDDDLEIKQEALPLRDKDLPALIREIVSNAPANRKIPSFIACLSPLCALATRVRLKYYYDSRPSALLLQVIIEAPQSAGKQFAADIERLLLEDTLKARDKEQRRLEQDYREKKKRRKANEKLEEEPKTTIRVIPATISKTVLVKRADFYERHLGDVLSFWMFADELAQVTDAGKQGYSNLRTIMRTAYDFGSRFGIDFASDNSYSAIVDINICSMFCTTPAALDDYMDKKAIEGGNITRTVLCQLEDQIGADGAIFKEYTPEQKVIIHRMLDRIMADVYDKDGALLPELNLDMSWLDKDVRKWCIAKGKEALESGSVALDVFRKRSSVSAFRIASLCYYLYLLESEGVGEGNAMAKGSFGELSPSSLNPPLAKSIAQKRARRIYLWAADFILNMLLKRWGKKFEDLNAKRNEGIILPSDRPKLIDKVTKIFTRDQLKAIMQQLDVQSPERVILSQWKANGWIRVLAKNQYEKLI